jgi:hypothetical protein
MFGVRISETLMWLAFDADATLQLPVREISSNEIKQINKTDVANFGVCVCVCVVSLWVCVWRCSSAVQSISCSLFIDHRVHESDVVARRGRGAGEEAMKAAKCEARERDEERTTKLTSRRASARSAGGDDMCAQIQKNKGPARH